MTTGVLAPSPIFPPASGFIPYVIDSRYQQTDYPYGAVDVAPEALVGARAASLPLAIQHATHAGALGLSFGKDDWYYRIHILPGQLLLGNVVSDEIFTIGVWNAHLDATEQLDAINPVNATGLALIGQADPPLVFSINQQRNYTLEVATLGPPTIDASYTFVFHDGESVEISISGSRITAWALTPDYTNPVSEKLAWKTDRMIAWTAKQQRRALRIAPRRTVSFSTPMTKLEKQYVENQLFAWQGLIWALPIWWDGQYLPANVTPGDVVVACDTVDRDFVAGGLAIILMSALSYEVLQITDFTATQLNLTRSVVGSWPHGAKLYPVRAARMLASTRISRSHMSYAELSPSFQIVEPCDWPAATGLPTYRGAPVLEDSPDTDQTAEGSYERDTFTIDTETGAITVIDTAGIGIPSNSHNWFMKGKAARAAFRSLMYLLKGAQGELWVPSYEADLTLVSNILSGDTNIRCANSGFGLFSGTLNRQDIRIELLSGAVFYRRITGSAVDSPTTELVSISSSLGANVAIAAVRRISFMALSTLAGDEVTLEHLTAIEGVAIASTPFKAVNHDI